MVFSSSLFCSCPCLTLSILGQSLTITGSLHMIGNEPFTRLVCNGASGRTYVLQGEILAELKNLQGATVELEGGEKGRTPDYQLPIFLVTGYRVLLINGREPLIGLLCQKEGRVLLRTENGRIYTLSSGFGEKMQEAIGTKVWVCGEVKGSCFSWLTKRYQLSVTSFGVIAPAE